MTRPLRSLLIGDISYYPSEFCFGISQGMTLLNHWHTAVDIRHPIDVIARRLSIVQPLVVFGHMLLWPPDGPAKAAALLELLADARRRWGTRVLIHDGDARTETRWPHDVSAAVDLALCNHTADRSAWNIPQLRWPYGAFTQREMAAPVPEFRCRLAFAGRLGGGIYQERTALIERCRDWLGDDFKVFPGQAGPHTLFRTPELAASAGAVLGFGRPESPGWVDVRTFMYPGAGGILLSDDVGGFLEPWAHYVPYRSHSSESVAESLTEIDRRGPEWRQRLRREAFGYVQSKHSAIARVQQALSVVGL